MNVERSKSSSSSSNINSRALEISRVFGVSSHKDACVALSEDLLAYVAGAGVVVTKIKDLQVQSQKFFCANSSTSTSNTSNSYSSANSYLNMIPGFAAQSSSLEKKYDSFGYPIDCEPEVIYGTNSSMTAENNNGGSNTNGHSSRSFEDFSTSVGGGSSPSKLANKVRTISCIAISPDMKLLAVGESGYQPRILIYSLAADSSCKPIFSIMEHQYGINKLKFSPDSKRLASLGYVNDGYLNIWQFTKNGKKSIIAVAANKCSAVVNQLIWESSLFLTVGTRHLKMWFPNEISDEVEEDNNAFKKLELLKGKNILLGPFIGSDFVDCCMINAGECLVLTDQGDLGLLDVCNTFDLKKIYQMSTNVNRIVYDDDDRLWYADEEVFKALNLSTILQDSESTSANDDDLEVTKRPLSPTRSQRNRKNTFKCLMKYKDNGLVFLSGKNEIRFFDFITNDTHPLVKSLTQKVSGFKKCFNGDLLTWSHDGIIGKLHDKEFVELYKVPLVPGDFISNELCSLELTNTEMFIGDKFGNLAIYDSNSFELLNSLKAHESSITGIVYFEIADQKLFVSISRDRMIQVFNRSTTTNNGWELIQTLSLHKGTLLDVAYKDGRLFVCSSDRSISVHKFELEKTETPSDTTDEACSTEEDALCNALQEKLQLQKPTSIKIYREKIISEKATPTSMRFSKDELIISTADKNLSIYKISERSIDKTRSLKLYNEQNDSLLVENFCIQDNAIYVSCNDKSLRCFNYINGKQLSCNWGHSESILGLLMIDEMNMISVGSDGCTIKWKVINVASLQQQQAEDNHGSLSQEQEEAVLQQNHTQRAMRKIIKPTTPLTPTSGSPTRRSGGMSVNLGSNTSSPTARSLSPTSRLMKSTHGDVPIHRNTSPTRSPVSTTRASTISRLSATATTASNSGAGAGHSQRSPLKESLIYKNRPDLSIQNNDEMDHKRIVKLLQNLQHQIIEDRYNKHEMGELKKEIDKTWRLMNDDNYDEASILEKYSDKLLYMIDEKLNSRQNK